MPRACCRDSVVMKVIADDKAEREGYIVPCRWCERHASYRGGRWIYSDEEPVSQRHATAADLITHPDRQKRISDVLRKPLLPCHTCGHKLVLAPADNICPVCTHDFAAPEDRVRPIEPQGSLSDLQMAMDRHHGKQWKDL